MAILLTVSLAGCDIIGEGSSAPEAVFVNEEIAESAGELDKVIAQISDGYHSSGKVNIRDISVWESLNSFYDSNPEMLFLRGIKGMEINYTMKSGYLEAEIFPQYEMFMNVIIAHESGDESGLTQEESRVYEKALEVVETCTSGLSVTFDKAYALHEYLTGNIVYDDNYSVNENAFNVYGALIQGRAVCQGYTQAYKLLLKLTDIDSLIVTGMAGNDKHAWNLVNYGSESSAEWYHTDVTWDDADSGSSNKYFNVTDKILGATHSWQMGEYPEANSTKYNYFMYKGRMATTVSAVEAAFESEFGSRGEEIRAGQVYFEILCKFNVTEEDLYFLHDYSDGGFQFSVDDYGGDTMLTIVL